MTKEEQIDWLCRLRADLNNGVILAPWKKEFTTALNIVIDEELKRSAKVNLSSIYGTMVTDSIYYDTDSIKIPESEDIND